MTIFFRLLEPNDKGAALQEAIAHLATGTLKASTFQVEPASFQQVPGSPFAYWVSNRVRQLFTDLEKFASEERVAKQGLATGDDFRHVRIWLEVASEKIVTGTSEMCPERFKEQTFLNKEWVAFAKGGGFSTYYSDIYLVVQWKDDGKEIRNFCNPKTGYVYSRYRGADFYFQKGLTWSDRTTSLFSTRIWSLGGIYSVKGSAGFFNGKELEILGWMNSGIFNVFLSLLVGAGDAAARSYQVGVIGSVPFPCFTPEFTATLATFARRAWSLKRRLDTVTQTSHAFILPALLQVSGSSLSQSATIWTEKVTAIETELAQIQTQIDALVFDLYGIAESDRSAVNSELIVVEESEPDEDDEEGAISADLPTLTRELLAYILSVAFGRFDVRLATSDRDFPAEPEPFDPLPVCSPGMLVDENELPPIEARSLPADYAIAIPFNGILVDDEGHPSDIISHVRNVLKVIWGDLDSDIEQEACEILKVNSLRDYFRKPASFFNDHLSRYSKSRRQAPIYLPLSTRSGSYTLWLYYHRLTDQTLYTCINDYVEPKLNRVSETVNSLRSQTNRSRDEEKSLDDLQTLEAELTELRDELLRVAKLPWKPNLNDGVQITVAPLYSLFRLSKWQKKLKETWDKLAKGDYDWAHLAHSIWTERVGEKCRTDKSLAIAHNLEDLYEPPPETPKRTKRSKKKE